MVKFICIHGNIGAGKSTFIENITKQQPDMNYVCLQEPLDKWGHYLQKYYDALDVLEKLPFEEIHQPTNIQTIKAQQDIINFEVIITNIRLQQYDQIQKIKYNQPKYAFVKDGSIQKQIQTQKQTQKQTYKNYWLSKNCVDDDGDDSKDGEENATNTNDNTNENNIGITKLPKTSSTVKDLIDKEEIIQQELIKETVYVFERSIEESWCIFCQTLQRYLTDEQWAFLKYFFETSIQQEVSFDTEIYLEVPTDELFKRIHKRGRKEESNMSFEYLDKLNAVYKKYYQKNVNKFIKM